MEGLIVPPPHRFRPLLFRTSSTPFCIFVSCGSVAVCDGLAGLFEDRFLSSLVLFLSVLFHLSFSLTIIGMQVYGIGVPDIATICLIHTFTLALFQVAPIIGSAHIVEIKAIRLYSGEDTLDLAFGLQVFTLLAHSFALPSFLFTVRELHIDFQFYRFSDIPPGLSNSKASVAAILHHKQQGTS